MLTWLPNVRKMAEKSGDLAVSSIWVTARFDSTGPAASIVSGVSL